MSVDDADLAPRTEPRGELEPPRRRPPTAVGAATPPLPPRHPRGASSHAARPRPFGHLVLKTLASLASAAVHAVKGLAPARRPAALGLVATLGLVAGRAQGGPLERVRWLAGCWELRSGARVTLEMWMPPDAGLMLGASRTTVGGAVREYEQLRLAAQATRRIG